MQNTQGDNCNYKISSKDEENQNSNYNHIYDINNTLNIWQTAVLLKQQYGIRIFFDGIVPKLYRAAVAHSVTFYVYELIMKKVI